MLNSDFIARAEIFLHNVGADLIGEYIEGKGIEIEEFSFGGASDRWRLIVNHTAGIVTLIRGDMVLFNCPIFDAPNAMESVFPDPENGGFPESAHCSFTEDVMNWAKNPVNHRVAEIRKWLSENGHQPENYPWFGCETDAQLWHEFCQTCAFEGIHPAGNQWERALSVMLFG